jgi:hypothetical protein
MHTLHRTYADELQQLRVKNPQVGLFLDQNTSTPEAVIDAIKNGQWIYYFFLNMSLRQDISVTNGKLSAGIKRVDDFYTVTIADGDRDPICGICKYQSLDNNKGGLEQSESGRILIKHLDAKPYFMRLTKRITMGGLVQKSTK